MTQPVQIEMPEASPDSYLRWMAFWADVERKMLERPGLEALASRESAPFLNGPVARLLHELTAAVREQALAARRGGLPGVSPRIEIQDASLMPTMASYISRRGAWLQANAKTIGIAPLTPELDALRRAVIQTLRDRSRPETIPD